MLTIEELKKYGANTDEGLKRCVNNEALYLRLVKMVLNNDGFQKLEDAINAHDLDAAFQAAHGLKGIAANLSLTPLLTPVSEVTELLRARQEADYLKYLSIIKEEKNKLELICKD